jgi:signal transduction histidine kinase/ActR/RegA family two-component response regulator
MTPTLPLRLLLAGAISLLALLLTIIVAYTVGERGVERVESEIGQALALLADQMQDKLDRGIFERAREISNTSRLVADLAATDHRPALQSVVEEVKASLPEYAWIGVADADGQLVASTDVSMIGSNVNKESWFSSGRSGPFVGQVHSPSPSLAKRLGFNGAKPGRIIDVASPIVIEGKIVGVLGASLNWSWAEDIKGSLFGPLDNAALTDVLVLDPDGNVILGPSEIDGRKLDLDSMRIRLDGPNRFSLERWIDGRSYLTGFARSDGYRQFAGLGLIVLVRQDAAIALAPARELEQSIAAWSAVFIAIASVLAWRLSEILAQPMLRLSKAAEQVRSGQPVEIPQIRAFQEAAILSDSLRVLIGELKSRESELRQLNASLEQQVASRTQELEAQNSELASAKEAAELATQSKSRFLAAASHDLRQPLHALSLLTRALGRRVDKSEAQTLVQQMELAVGSLKEMFDTLLDVSRLDAGLVRPDLQVVELAPLLHRVASGLEEEAHHRGLSFRLQTMDVTVVTDPAILSALLRNLVSNAVKFTQSGAVLLGCREVNGRLRLEVCDTGVGIAPDRLSSVFEEFNRSKTTATGVNDGLGLGLSLVRRYAELLSMDVVLRSKPGLGTRFELNVGPNFVGSAPSDTADNERAPIELAGQHILVLDDEPLIRAALGRDLSDRGSTVMLAESVAEAESLLRNATRFPDLAVVDINLSGTENGPAFIERMERQLSRRLPSLVLTGSTDSETLIGLSVGRHPWLTKPADPETIAEALSNMAAGRQTL